MVNWDICRPIENSKIPKFTQFTPIHSIPHRKYNVSVLAFTSARLKLTTLRATLL